MYILMSFDLRIMPFVLVIHIAYITAFRINYAQPSTHPIQDPKTKKGSDRRRGRTCNLLIRSQAPCHWASRPTVVGLLPNVFGSGYQHRPMDPLSMLSFLSVGLSRNICCCNWTMFTFEYTKLILHEYRLLMLPWLTSITPFYTCALKS